MRAELPIGSRVNLMQRNLTGNAALELIDSEDRADRVALALLAPAHEVLSATLDAPHSEQIDHLQHLLVHQYGLPAQPAAHYALALLDCIGSTPSTWQNLRGQGSRKKTTITP